MAVKEEVPCGEEETDAADAGADDADVKEADVMGCARRKRKTY